MFISYLFLYFLILDILNEQYWIDLIPQTESTGV